MMQKQQRKPGSHRPLCRTKTVYQAPLLGRPKLDRYRWGEPTSAWPPHKGSPDDRLWLCHLLMTLQESLQVQPRPSMWKIQTAIQGRECIPSRLRISLICSSRAFCKFRQVRTSRSSCFRRAKMSLNSASRLLTLGKTRHQKCKIDLFVI